MMTTCGPTATPVRQLLHHRQALEEIIHFVIALVIFPHFSLGGSCTDLFTSFYLSTPHSYTSISMFSPSSSISTTSYSPLVYAVAVALKPTRFTVSHTNITSQTALIEEKNEESNEPVVVEGNSKIISVTTDGKYYLRIGEKAVIHCKGTNEKTPLLRYDGSGSQYWRKEEMLIVNGTDDKHRTVECNRLFANNAARYTPGVIHRVSEFYGSLTQDFECRTRGVKNTHIYCELIETEVQKAPLFRQRWKSSDNTNGFWRSNSNVKAGLLPSSSSQSTPFTVNNCWGCIGYWSLFIHVLVCTATFLAASYA